MTFNYLGLIVLGLLVIEAAVTICVAVRMNIKDSVCSLTENEIENFTKESIIMRTYSKPIFKDQSCHEVILNGMDLMKSDNYNMLRSCE